MLYGYGQRLEAECKYVNVISRVLLRLARKKILFYLYVQIIPLKFDLPDHSKLTIIIQNRINT